MKITPQHRVRRTLSRLDRFQLIDQIGGNVPAGLELPGRLLGVYNYSPSKLSETVWVSDQGISTFSGDWQSILFRDISRIESPPKESDDNNLIILMSDDSSRIVPVVGRRGRFRDIFEFVRFLNRVVGDLRETLRIDDLDGLDSKDGNVDVDALGEGDPRYVAKTSQRR